MPTESESEVRSADDRTVTADYFDVMAIRLTAGRPFDRRDTASAPPVVIVDEAFVDRFLGPAHPLWLSLQIQQHAAEIVCVVENSKHASLCDAYVPTMYVPYSQGNAPGWIFFALRCGSHPRAAVPAVRKAVAQVVPDRPVYNVWTMGERLERSLATERLYSLLFSAFATLALILCSAGVYGLVAYEARVRLREIAVHRALGARS